MPPFQSNCKYIAQACLGGLALFNGVAAQPVSSRAFCRVVAISRGAKVMQDAYTNAWLDIGNYVCGAQADEPTIVNIDVQVQDVAVAIAEAFAEVSINCRAEGNADVRATGYAIAEQRAEALGRAVTEIFASAEVCDMCSATVSAISSTTMELISVAVAESWAQLYLFSDAGTTVEDLIEVTSNVIVETIATVLSGISGTIRAGADDGCSIDIIESAQVGDFLAICNLAASGDVREISVDAITEAGAEAVAYACNGDIAMAEVDVIARATASALAQAVAQAEVFCETNGGDDTMACGLVEVDVRAVASAQAEAFASAFARAETCGCDVSGSAEVSVWEEIWVEAVANAYAEGCVAGNGDIFVPDFESVIVERTLTATSRAIATAVAIADEVEGNTCRITANPCSHLSEFCVPGRGICGGTRSGFDDVQPCCEENSRCFRMNENRFLCRPRTATLPSSWDGRIEVCTIGLAE